MRIVFFNHKGGVSKTTTTFHLGWKLATLGKRVLMIDADPQCNLTALVLRERFEEFYINEETKLRNIKDGISSAFLGRPEPIQYVECISVVGNDNLFLLPGHPNLTELEPSLSFAQTSNNAFATMQNLPGAFNALIELTCEHHNIDYVMIDLNPGLGAINQNLFTISDVFIVPTNPDPFSLMAVNTLSSVLPRWKLSAEQMVPLFENSSYPFPTRAPRLAGVVIQRFNIRNGQPAAPFRNNMDEILQAVNDTLVPNLRNAGMLFPDEAYEDIGIGDDHCIAEVPDFQSLLPASHNNGVPVFSLTDLQINRTGTVLEQMIIKRDLFNTQFTEFANKIIGLENYA